MYFFFRLDSVNQTVGVAKQHTKCAKEMGIYEDSNDYSRKSFAHSRNSRRFSLRKNSSTKRKIEDESIEEPKRIHPQSEGIEVNNLCLNSKTSPAKLTRVISKKMVPNNKVPKTTSPIKVSEVKHEGNSEVCTFKMQTKNSPQPNGIISKQIDKNNCVKPKENDNKKVNGATVFKSSSSNKKELKEVVDKNLNIFISTSTFEPQITKESSIDTSQSKSCLVVNLFKKKKTRKCANKTYNSFKMSNKEIDTYFSQLERLALHNQAERTNPINVKPFVWTQIRDPVKLSVKHSSNRSKASITKRSRFSKQEKAKLTSCFVVLENLTLRNVDLICKEHQVKINSNLFSNKKCVIGKVNSNSNVYSKIVKKSMGSKIVKKSMGNTSCTTHSESVCKNVYEGGLNCLELKPPKSNKKKCKSKRRYRSNSNKNNTSKTLVNSIENKQVMKKATSKENYSSEINNSFIDGQKSELSNVSVSLEKLSLLSSNTKLEITIKDDTNIPNQGEDDILIPDVNMSNVETASNIFDSSGSESSKNKMATTEIENRPKVRKNYSDEKNLKKTKVEFDEMSNSSKYSSQTPLVPIKYNSDYSLPIVLLQDNIKMSHFLSVQEKTTDIIEKMNKTTETSSTHDECKLKVKNNDWSKLKKQENDKISSSAKVMSSASKEPQINVNDKQSFLMNFSTSYVLSCNRREYGNSSSEVLNGMGSSENLKTTREKDFSKKYLLKTSTKHNKAVVRKHKQSASQLKLSLKTKNKATDINIASIKEAKCLELTQKENLNVSDSSVLDSKYQHSLIKHPIVCIDRLTEFLLLNKSEKELNVKEKKRSLSVDNMLSPCEPKRGSLICPKVRRSLRLHSLDGAFDNSSSDDNVSDKDGISEKPISTPKKKRPHSSKNSQTPKASYVPLDIKITKSPTVQVERIPILDKQRSFLNNVEPHPEPNDSLERICTKTSTTHDSSTKFSNSESVEPCNKITKLEPKINLTRVDLPSCSFNTAEKSVDFSKSCSFEARNDLKIFTKAHPIIKKLKVNIKRLSCDTQGL